MLERWCHALVGCCREVSGLVQKSEICCVDVLTLILLLWAKGMATQPQHPQTISLFTFGQRLWAEALDPFLC